MRAATGSQCKEIKRGVTWDLFGSLKTSRAAAFWIIFRDLILFIHIVSIIDLAYIYIYIYIYTYILGVARYMYSYRTITLRTSRLDAWGLMTNTGNLLPIQKGVPAIMQRCLITASASRRTANPVSCPLENKAHYTVSTDAVLILKASHTWTDKNFVLVYPTSLIQH